MVSGPYLRRQHRLDQGFEIFDDEPSSRGGAEAHDDVTNPAMLEALRRFLVEQRDQERPFFLFAYLWDPHYDYIPPEPYDRMFVEEGAVPVDASGFGTSDLINEETSEAELDWIRSQYDGEIAWTDEMLSELFDILRDEGLWDDTIVVVTSDHGEEFFEHGKKGHKNNLFVESVHVPLLIKYAGDGPTGRDSRPASLVDLFPTLTEEAGLWVEGPLHGRSLREPNPDPDRPLFFELLTTWYYPGEDGQVDDRKQEWIGVMQGSHRLLGVPASRMFLFDRSVDPREQTNLLRHGEKPSPIALQLDRLLQGYASEMALTRELFEAGGVAEVDPEQLERLRSLGYIQ